MGFTDREIVALSGGHTLGRCHRFVVTTLFKLITSFIIILSFSHYLFLYFVLKLFHSSARSGFDGPWTTHPLRFDNEYYKNLLHRTWVPRKWDGPKQFEDEETGKLMMLPSDMALVNDSKFKPIVEEYPSISPSYLVV